MWLQVCFDLPVLTKKQRRQYTIFRKKILEDGFIQMQYSVYIRYCASPETADVHERRIQTWVPPEGHIWVIRLTDSQYGNSRHFWGKNKAKKDNLGPGAQLELF